MSLNRLSALMKRSVAPINCGAWIGRTRQIQELFTDKPLLIADGHHRYETALAFRDEMHARTPQLTGYNHMMMNLVRIESPGLAVLAIHRLIQGLTPDKIAHVVAKLPEAFDVQKVDSLASLMEHLTAQHGKHPAFGLYTPDNTYRLLIPRLTSETSGYERLDVTLLHNLLIDKQFGIETTPAYISYTADATDAVALCQRRHRPRRAVDESDTRFGSLGRGDGGTDDAAEVHLFLSENGDRVRLESVEGLRR